MVLFNSIIRLWSGESVVREEFLFLVDMFSIGIIFPLNRFLVVPRSKRKNYIIPYLKYLINPSAIKACPFSFG